jgi:hypothetical protein
MNVGNLRSVVAAIANQAAPAPPPVTQANPVSFPSQLSALGAPASAPPTAPTVTAAPNTMVLLKLLAALSKYSGTAQPSQAAVCNIVAQIPNGNVASNFQGFLGATSNFSQPTSRPGAASAYSQPAHALNMMSSQPLRGEPGASTSSQPYRVEINSSQPHLFASSTTAAPGGGSMNTTQVAALLQLLQSSQGRQG